MSTGDFIIPFGKYQGKPAADVPTGYLDWLLGETRDPDLRHALLAHLRTRADWQSEDLDE